MGQIKLVCEVESGRAGWGFQVEVWPQARGVSGGRTRACSGGQGCCRQRLIGLVRSVGGFTEASGE